MITKALRYTLFLALIATLAIPFLPAHADTPCPDTWLTLDGTCIDPALAVTPLAAQFQAANLVNGVNLTASLPDHEAVALDDLIGDTTIRNQLYVGDANIIPDAAMLSANAPTMFTLTAPQEMDGELAAGQTLTVWTYSTRTVTVYANIGDSPVEIETDVIDAARLWTEANPELISYWMHVMLKSDWKATPPNFRLVLLG